MNSGCFSVEPGMIAAAVFAVLFFAPIVVLIIRFCQAMWGDLRP